MFIKPNASLKIRDPELRDFLPEEGREVLDSLHWQKLLKDGDVHLTKAEPMDPEKKFIKK